jgi:hypothetical protein
MEDKKTHKKKGKKYFRKQPRTNVVHHNNNTKTHKIKMDKMHM